MTPLLLLLGLAIGAVLGLTGAGGSIFAVPLLMWGLHWSLPQATPVALLAVSASALIGTLAAWDVSYIRYRAALLMAGCGWFTAPLGIQLAHSLPVSLLNLLFAVVLTIVALRMLRQAIRKPEEANVVRATVAGDGEPAAGPCCRLDPLTGRIQWTWRCAVTIASGGGATGFLAGLIGVGGGFVIVPLLRATTELSMHSAVATSLMVIALTSAGTVVSAILMQGIELPWGIALPFIAGTVAGMLGGRQLAPRIAGVRLQQLFALLMLIVAVGMAFHALSG